MLLNNRLNQIQSQIDAYLEQIAKLQASVTQLQTHAQEVQTVEQAAESALSQISTALSMLQAVCPDEIATFKAAVDAKFREPVSYLEAAVDNVEPPIEQPPVTPAPEPESDITVEASAVTVEESDPALTQPESANTSTEITSNATNGNSNGHGHRVLTYDELKKLDKRTLADLMTSQLIAQGNYRNGDKEAIAKTKKDTLLTQLDGTVTEAELATVQQGQDKA